MGYERKEVQSEWEEKRPDQLFIGIESGSLISLKDKKVFLPTHRALQNYYGLGENPDDFRSDHSFAFEFK